MCRCKMRMSRLRKIGMPDCVGGNSEIHLSAITFSSSPAANQACFAVEAIAAFRSCRDNRTKPRVILEMVKGEDCMKGIVLAGGTGSRLNPLTRVTNKHLLPIFDKPMIYYPIQTLVNAGIEEILLVTGGKNAGDFLRLLGNGRDFGLKHLNYTYQEGEGGIAEALGLAEFFAGGDPICVILGDNIIENNVCQAVENFRRQKTGAKILLKEVDDAQRFGVAELRGQQVIGIEEKPAAPKSAYA